MYGWVIHKKEFLFKKRLRLETNFNTATSVLKLFVKVYNAYATHKMVKKHFLATNTMI